MPVFGLLSAYFALNSMTTFKALWSVLNQRKSEPITITVQ